MGEQSRLEVIDLCHRFGDRVAVSDVGFEVASGEIVGLVGRNGAGKTTTMRSIMSLLTPERGTIRWRDQPVETMPRELFGYMPEERGLYPQMTVVDQVTYFATLQG